MQPKDPLTCAIYHRAFPRRACTSIEALGPSLKARIAKAHPGCDVGGWICPEDLNKLRTGVVEDILASGTGELTQVEQEVVDSIQREELLTRKLMGEEEGAPATFGQRMADRVASFGGSWSFLIAFGFFMVAWIVVNAALALFYWGNAFDPYPFILLNLILSCLASVQAPIMMSQNRKEARDRQRAESIGKSNAFFKATSRTQPQPPASLPPLSLPQVPVLPSIPERPLSEILVFPTPDMPIPVPPGSLPFQSTQSASPASQACPWQASHSKRSSSGGCPTTATSGGPVGKCNAAKSIRMVASVFTKAIKRSRPPQSGHATSLPKVRLRSSFQGIYRLPVVAPPDRFSSRGADFGTRSPGCGCGVVPSGFFSLYPGTTCCATRFARTERRCRP